jgi:hypothetical protein
MGRGGLLLTLGVMIVGKVSGKRDRLVRLTPVLGGRNFGNTYRRFEFCDSLVDFG